jgi:uroporphyrinogen III methyltransferase/synthase
MGPRLVTYVAAGAPAPSGDRAAIVADEAPVSRQIEAFAQAGRPVVRVLPAGAAEALWVRDELRALVRAGLGVELVPTWPASEVRAVFGDAPAIAAVEGSSQARAWMSARALFGKRVLLARAREQASETAELVRSRGAEPVLVPTIEIGPPSDPASLRRALSDVRAGRYGWVAFTSANGVERTWAELEAEGGDARSLSVVRIAAIGPATARALAGHGLRADVVAREFRGEGLAAAMLEAMGLGPSSEGGPPAPRVLLARAARARDVLPEALRDAGCVVDVVAAYETRPPPVEVRDSLARELEGGRIDAVAFTSSSTVENLCDLLGDRAPSLLAPLRIAAIGPITRDTAVARGLRVDVVPAEYTVPALVSALAESYG